jgi:hypothetical protein
MKTFVEWVGRATWPCFLCAKEGLVMNTACPPPQVGGGFAGSASCAGPTQPRTLTSNASGLKILIPATIRHKCSATRFWLRSHITVQTRHRVNSMCGC